MASPGARAAVRNATTLVLGIGNELMSDDGLGVHVVRALGAGGRPPPGAELAEAGAALLDFLPEMSRHARVILVDAIRAGGEPGTVYRADSAEGIQGLKAAAPFSLHEWGVTESLAAGRLLGLLPARLTLFGAEPAHLEPGTRLSLPLARARDRIVALLRSELAAPRD